MQENKLYKSETDKVLFGVAGGLAEYFNVDPTLVRVIFIVLTVWGGVGILLYIILAIAMPEKPGKKGAKVAEKKTNKKAVVEERVKTKDVESTRKWQGEQVFGMILLGVGLIFLLENFVPGFSFGRLWPLILIGIGLWLLAGREDKEK